MRYISDLILIDSYIEAIHVGDLYDVDVIGARGRPRACALFIHTISTRAQIV